MPAILRVIFISLLFFLAQASFCLHATRAGFSAAEKPLLSVIEAHQQTIEELQGDLRTAKEIEDAPIPRYKIKNFLSRMSAATAATGFVLGMYHGSRASQSVMQLEGKTLPKPPLDPVQPTPEAASFLALESHLNSAKAWQFAGLMALAGYFITNWYYEDDRCENSFDKSPSGSEPDSELNPELEQDELENKSYDHSSHNCDDVEINEDEKLALEERLGNLLKHLEMIKLFTKH